MAGLGTQRVKPQVKKRGKLNSNILPIKDTDQYVCHIFWSSISKTVNQLSSQTA